MESEEDDVFPALDAADEEVADAAEDDEEEACGSGLPHMSRPFCWRSKMRDAGTPPPPPLLDDDAVVLIVALTVAAVE